MENREKFKQLFQLPNKGFLNPIDLIDTDIGFSVYKERKETGFKSLFRVYIKNEDLKSGILKPINITASYGKEYEGGITVSSTEFKRKINWPIDFISEGEFFYNIETNKIFLKDNKTEITGLDLLIKADNLHMRTTRLSGIRLHIEIFLFHYALTAFFKIIFKIISAFQYLVSGEKIKIFDNLKDPNKYSRISTNKPLDIKKGELIDLWGYKVKPWIAGIYSFLHLLIFLILWHFNYKPQWLITIFNNNFLSFMYGIISLGLANTFLPIFLSPINFKGILKLIQSMHWKFAIRKIKMKI